MDVVDSGGRRLRRSDEGPAAVYPRIFLASNNLVVPPVVILDNTLRPILNTAEVAALFSHPLSAFLSSNPPLPAEPETLEVPYHSSHEWTYANPNGAQHVGRVHRFITGREAGGMKPVFGLTAANPHTRCDRRPRARARLRGHATRKA
ncbi:Glycoside hydrolase family 5 protein [Mycena indigotica]|uniref:Glycoside hydrolase family 5 protein n=1 Tax=Mycena indigotica TaxID=2126181 RepID=A0A8H6T3Q1_9AGAR|nr:Glycoside hydrolase family 5 protein [Mycena indigotica]KAF7309327.1 Glycoside hydrolase family 5 protein [Mycena indigotica]